MKHRSAITPRLRFLGCITMAWVGILSGRLSAEETPEAGFSARSSIETRLVAARAELKALPEGAAPALNEALQRLTAAQMYHLDAIGFLTTEEAKRDKAKLESSTWHGFTQSPPYSIVLLDGVRESIAVIEQSQRTAEARLRIYETELDGLQNTLADHQQAQRRFREAAEKAANPDSRQSADLSAQRMKLEARIDAEKIGRLQLAISTEQASLDMLASNRELAARKLKAINGKTTFTPEELDKLLQPIISERDKVNQILVEESESRPSPNPLLTWKVEFLTLQKSFWEARFILINSSDRTEIRAATATLKKLQTRVDDWVKIADLRLAGNDIDTTVIDPVSLHKIVPQIRSMQRRIGFALKDLEGWSLMGRGTPILDRITATLLAIWNAELYLVEESDIQDGRKIAIYRAITVAKLVRLAFILLVGWFTLRYISRRVNAAVARRGKIPQATADLAGKWAFGFGLVLLILYGLNAVSIPLTAFAFLGGALAIGIGFGTQTLLKNFISGIILLFERPLKVGDVVEVADIVGTIKLIGIRASVIQHFDGIDTLVPNSILLENQLTNWSFSSTVIRHSILVGVAYGSPTREVSRLLLAVAAGHGLVKKDPAPEVRFEDFADNSLTFSLLFWLDVKKVARNALASDLRYMIDKAFAEAGVTISFPQRDLHFDPDKPLRVELSRSPTTKPTTSTKP
ncbi:MAG: mechanosensitive ion channel [Akkermansiaceae bacterium]|nr:mechanosensitive ion channel [Akkermansiaceae bacterium]MCF7733786.1 mechanosensitive ion channel [Akkermansiaceae bacterium]